MIRVLIPELYADGRSSLLSQDEQAKFYEQGLRPAVQKLAEDQSREWPATYIDEMFRARGRNGQLNFQTKIIPAWHVRQLGNAIRSSLERNGSSWSTGLVFLHQIRGVKHSSQHSLTQDSAKESLVDFLRENQLLNHDFSRLTASSRWWIDVGVEIASTDQRCLAWRTDSHRHIVHALLGIDRQNADRITSPGSSQYARDPTSHLTAVSGCRVTPGPRARGSYDLQYLQLYTTDKALIYRPDQGRFGKFITPADILKGKGIAYAENLYTLYRNAIDNNYSLARVEVRVPLDHGLSVLLDISDDLIRDSLLSFSPNTWW